MKVSYTGIHSDLPPKVQAKLDTKFAKLSKFLDGRGEKSAHVVVTNERHLQQAEITLRFYDHELVAVGTDADLFIAMSTALAKLEKQAVKLRSRWREKHRRSESGKPESEAASEPMVFDTDGERRVFRVNHYRRSKPITLEEAVIQVEEGRKYLVFRDAEREDSISVLIRRDDGHFDLIES